MLRTYDLAKVKDSYVYYEYHFLYPTMSQLIYVKLLKTNAMRGSFEVTTILKMV